MDAMHQKLFERATHVLAPLGFKVVEFWKGIPELVIDLPTVEEAKALALQVADILNDEGIECEMVRYVTMLHAYINDACEPGMAQQIIDN